MKPRPRPRHLVAIILLAAVAAISGSLAAIDNRVSPSQIDLATAALRSEYHQLYPVDWVFSDRGLWRLTSPAFRGLMELVLVPTRFIAPVLPFRCMVGVLVMIHLAGMYALIYRQTRSWSTSVYCSILSIAVVFTIGRWFWGIGPLESVTPAALVAVTVPLVVLAYLEHQDDWRIVLVFLFIGLLGNVHLVSAMNLAIVLILTYLGQRRFAPATWPTALACLLAAAAGALPYTAYFFALQQSMHSAQPGQPGQAIYRALRAAEFAVLYPDLLGSVLGWLLYSAVLVVPAVAVLLRFARYRVPDRGFWAWLILSGLIVSMGLQGLSQSLGALEHQVPLVIDFIQASVYVMLAVHVLFAQAILHLFRIVRTHRTALRWALTAVAIVWLLPSDNLRVVRHSVYSSIPPSLMPFAQPRRMVEVRLRAARNREMRQIARWARKHTQPGSVFLLNDVEFRLYSRRSLLASLDDIDFIYYLSASDVQRWLGDIRMQQQILYPSNQEPDPVALAGWVSRLADQQRFQRAQAWYAVLPSQACPSPTAQVREVLPIAWGDHYRVFRILPRIEP